jgi:hypothetical protein
MSQLSKLDVFTSVIRSLTSIKRQERTWILYLKYDAGPSNRNSHNTIILSLILQVRIDKSGGKEDRHLLFTHRDCVFFVPFIFLLFEFSCTKKVKD